MKKQNSLINELINKLPKIAYYYLCAWCSLPALMSLIIFYFGFTKQFPTKEEVEAEGLTLGNVAYNLTLETYQKLFCILGILTIAFAIFVLLLKGKDLFKKTNIKNQPWFFLFLALLLWALVASCQAENPSLAFKGSSYRYDGYFTYLIYAAIFICASLLVDAKHKLRIAHYYCFVITYLAILMFIQELGFSSFLDYCFPATRAVVFNQFNHFGYMLALSGILYAALYLTKKKHVYLLGFVIVLYALLINDTFGSYLGLLCGLIFMYLLYYLRGNKLNVQSLIPLAIFGGLSLINVGGLLPLADDSLAADLSTFSNDIEMVSTRADGYQAAGTGRMQLWLDTLNVIKRKPLFGVGPEGLVGEYEIWSGTAPHNEYLQIAAYLGIPALILYLSALLSLAIHHFKNLKKLSPSVLVASCAVATYLFQAFVGNPMFNTTPYLWIFLGICTSGNETETPLLLPSEKKTSDFKIRKKPLILFGCILILLASLSIPIYLANERRYEADYEASDLSIMELANNLAKIGYQEGGLQLGEYWYDDASFSLISTSEEKPSTYGQGTSYDGGYLASANKQETYGYDDTVDYRNKLLKITLSLDADEELVITLQWE